MCPRLRIKYDEMCKLQCYNWQAERSTHVLTKFYNIPKQSYTKISWCFDIFNIIRYYFGYHICTLYLEKNKQTNYIKRYHLTFHFQPLGKISSIWEKTIQEISWSYSLRKFSNTIYFLRPEKSTYLLFIHNCVTQLPYLMNII